MNASLTLSYAEREQSHCFYDDQASAVFDSAKRCSKLPAQRSSIWRRILARPEKGKTTMNARPFCNLVIGCMELENLILSQ